jgi:hypothetical protein
LAGNGVTHAVVVLVDDAAEAATIADVITDMARPAGIALAPPRRGASFFADTDGASDVDRWWRENVPPGAVPVYVLDFSPGVLAWLPGLDGDFFIRGLPPGLAADVGASVAAIDASSPLEVAGQVLRHLAAGGACNVEDAEGLLAFARATDPHPPALATGVDAAVPAPNPFDLLVTMPPAQPPPPQPPPPQSPRPSDTWRDIVPGPSVRSTANRRSVSDMLRLPNWRGLRTARPDALADDTDLASALARRGSTIVAVGSRKGGVGKPAMRQACPSLPDRCWTRSVIAQ